ncbi:hypothetical protein ABES09_25820, partial [Priestia megaterium]
KTGVSPTSLQAFFMNTSRKTDVYSMDFLLSWTREINHHTKNMMVSVINSKKGKLFMENIF